MVCGFFLWIVINGSSRNCSLSSLYPQIILDPQEIPDLTIAGRPFAMLGHLGFGKVA
jgi:hypothetical protein